MRHILRILTLLYILSIVQDNSLPIYISMYNGMYLMKKGPRSKIQENMKLPNLLIWFVILV